MTADVRLVIKPKNARMCRAMEAMGYSTVAELCHGLGLKVGSRTYYNLLDLCSFRLTPVKANGVDWRAGALEVAALLQAEPGDLWPEHMRQLQIQRSTVSLDVSVAQLAATHGSEQQIIDRDLVSKLLTRLPAREKLVLEMHYGLNGKGEHTFGEIAPVLGLTTQEGVRRIEQNAMRRCYHWVTHKRRPFYPEGDVVEDDDEMA